MKKNLYIFSIFISFLAYSQDKITADQALKSNDTKVLAAFIKNNPNDPKTPAVRQKLTAIVLGDKPKEVREQVAKPKIVPMNTKQMEKDVKSNTANSKSTDSHEKTAALLTHILNNDPGDKNAYVQIVNKSKCNLIVKISGKKFYNLTVPASNQNYIMVEKGNYTISTNVCDAKYSSTKNISKDIILTLNAPK